MSNRFFITLLVIIAVVIGAFVFTKQGSDTESPSSSAQPTNHVKGSESSGVVLVEYGDFQCPACAQYFPIVQQVYEKYKDKIQFQFRHFPLVQIHQNAFVSSRAAEAASNQDKFWEMHDLLYQNQQTWGTASNPNTFFDSYAKSLGLDISKFQQDMASQQTNDKINADVAEAKKLSASSTPTFVLDGKKIENPRSLEEFEKVLDDALATKKQ